MSDSLEDTVHPPSDQEPEGLTPSYKDPEPTALLSNLVQGSHNKSFNSTALDNLLPLSSRYRNPFSGQSSSSLPSFAQPHTASSSTLPTPPVSRVGQQVPLQHIFSQPPAPLPPIPQALRTPTPPPPPMTSSGSSGAPAATTSIPSIIKKVIVQKISPLKGSEDYAVWSSKIRDLLFQLKLDGHIKNDYITLHNKDATWDKDNCNALIAIRSCIDEGACIHVMLSTTAINAWDKLKEMFKVHGMLVQLFQRQKLDSIQMVEGDNLEHHIRKLRTKFETMQCISGDTSRWNQVEWITLLIGLLPASWKPVIQTLPVEYEQGLSPTITAENQKKMVQTVTEQLLAKEARLKGETAPKGESGMFNRDQPMKFPNTNPNTGKKPGNCHNCGKWGHWASECRSSGGENQNGNNRGSNLNFRRRYNNNCEREQHSNTAINNPKDEYGMMAIHNQSQTTPLKQFWVADSGATTHICNNKTVMYDLQKVNGTVDGVNSAGTYEYIGKVDLKVQPTHHKGKRTNEKTLKLSNVAYIPEAPTNLLSVPLVMKKHPEIIILMNELGVKATLNDELVFHGQKISDIGSGGLYQIACTPTKQESAAYTYYPKNRTPHKAFYGKKHEQIGCLTAQLQGVELDSSKQYHKEPVDLNDDMADTESSSSDEEIILPKNEDNCVPKEEAFNTTNQHKSTCERVTSMHKTHNLVPIYDIGNDKPSFVGHIVPARSCSPIPSILSSSTRRVSLYDRIYSPKVDINSFFNDFRPSVNPLQPEHGSKAFDYAHSEQLCLTEYDPYPKKPCVFRRKQYSDVCEGEYNSEIKFDARLNNHVDDLMVCANAEVLENIKFETTHDLKQDLRFTDPGTLSFYAMAIRVFLCLALIVCPDIIFAILFLSSANLFITRSYLNKIEYLVPSSTDDSIYDAHRKFIEYTFTDANRHSDYDDKLRNGVEITPPTVIFHNQGLIATFADPRPKHINIKFDFARDAANNGDVNDNYIRSNDNRANIFTKALPYALFSTFKSQILNSHSNVEFKSDNLLSGDAIQMPSVKMTMKDHRSKFEQQNRGENENTSATRITGELSNSRSRGNVE